MIRLATLEDIDELLRMGRLFFKASGYADTCKFNEESILQVTISLIEAGTLLYSKGAMLGYTLVPLYIGFETISQELFWWVDEDMRGTGVGLELLRTMEEESLSKGADLVSMICLEGLEGDKVASLYTSQGYIPMEKSFIKKIRSS